MAAAFGTFRDTSLSPLGTEGRDRPQRSEGVPPASLDRLISQRVNHRRRANPGTSPDRRGSIIDRIGRRPPPRGEFGLGTSLDDKPNQSMDLVGPAPGEPHCTNDQRTSHRFAITQSLPPASVWGIRLSPMAARHWDVKQESVSVLRMFSRSGRAQC